MRFEDLLRDADLGIAVVHAPPGGLDREVTGAYITDLPDPSRFISSGEVVLTSGMWAGRPGAAETFVKALAERDATALIVGLVYLGNVPDEVLALCREHGLMLATISDKVSFKSVVDAVGALRAGSASGATARGLRFAAHLAELVASGGSADTVLEEFAAEFGVECWIVDEFGGLVAKADADPTSADLGTVWNAVLGESGVPGPIHVEGEPGWTAWPIFGTQRQVVGHLVCAGDQRSLVREAPIVVEGVIGALRVDLEFSARHRLASRGPVSDLVHALVQDSASVGEVSARMRLESLDPQQPTSIAIAEVADAGFPSGAVLEMAFRLLTAAGAQAAGCVVDDRAVVLVNGPAALGAASLEAFGDEFAPFLAGRQLRIGMSDAKPGVGHLGPAIASAASRLREAAGTGPIVVASSSEVRTHRAILAEMGDRGRATFAREVLAPLLDYDARHGADLVTTLRVFLTNGGAWQESARQLHLHTNTLRYRIARVEELTGRSLGEMGDRVDLYLALSCLAS